MTARVFWSEAGDKFVNLYKDSSLSIMRARFRKLQKKIGLQDDHIDQGLIKGERFDKVKEVLLNKSFDSLQTRRNMAGNLVKMADAIGDAKAVKLWESLRLDLLEEGAETAVEALQGGGAAGGGGSAASTTDVVAQMAMLMARLRALEGKINKIT